MANRKEINRVVRLTSSLLLGLTVLACGIDGESGDEGTLIVATTSILGDIATHVAGDEARVEVLIPIGFDSHDFQPSAQQASLIADADLVVANGLGLEPGVQDVLESAADDGTTVIEVAPLVDPIPFAAPDKEAEDGGEDPHFWMDPIRVGDAAMTIAVELAEFDPDGSWVNRAREYADEMSATDEAIRELLAAVPEGSRRMVTNHEAFGYFAVRYGFDVIGVVIPGGSTLAEPSSAELAELVAVMESEDIRVIFAETTQPTTLAKAVAAELDDDVEVVELFTESLGPPGSGAETVSKMLTANAQLIAAALE
jgi:zinc/manganese transport system substrate-binding protein